MHFYYINNCATNLYDNLKALNDKDHHVIDINMNSSEEIAMAIKNTDLLVVDASLFNFEHWTPGIHKSIRTPHWRDIFHYLNIQELVLNSKNLKILIAPFHDLHTPIYSSEYSNKEIGKNFQALIWMYERGVKDTKDLNSHNREKWMPSDGEIQEIHKDFTKNFPLRIEFLHSINDNEFLLKNKSKYWDVNVPGRAYTERLIALESAKSLDLRIAPYYGVEKIVGRTFKVTEQIINTENSKKIKDEIRKKNFQFSISHSKVTWSDGSYFGYPVRKYFEIPALRSALVMSAFPGHEDYGFIDNENCVIVDADNFGQVAKMLIKNDIFREKISSNAFKMVNDLHSGTSRARQITDVLSAICQGSRIKASFHKGMYSIEKE